MALNKLLLKLLVLLIVLVIWFQLSLFRMHQTEISIPLRIVTLADDFIVTNQRLSTVAVLIEGKGMDILRFKRIDYSIEVDASDFQLGANEVFLTEQNIVLSEPHYQRLINFYLSQKIVLNIDRLVTKLVPIEMRFLTIEDEMFFQEQTTILHPERIEITGPKESLDRIAKITTVPLTSSLSNEERPTIELEIPDEILSITPDAVELTIEIAETYTRTIPLISIDYPQNRGFSIIPQYVTVKVEGTQNVIQNLTHRMIRATVDIPETFEYDFANIVIVVPNNVRLVEYTPQRVQLIPNE